MNLNTFDITLVGIPQEVTVQIVNKLSKKDLSSTARVCKLFNAISDKNDVWEMVVRREIGDVIDHVMQLPNQSIKQNYKKYVLDGYAFIQELERQMSFQGIQEELNEIALSKLFES